jgi:hypothetical protein
MDDNLFVPRPCFKCPAPSVMYFPLLDLDLCLSHWTADSAALNAFAEKVVETEMRKLDVELELVLSGV